MLTGYIIEFEGKNKNSVIVDMNFTMDFTRVNPVYA